MENTNRSVFALSGVTGMLIATVLLLSILVVLTYLGIVAQQNVMQKPYKLVDPTSVEMKSSVEKAAEVMVIKEQNMSNVLESLIVIGLVIAAAITAWSVLTPNSLFIG